MPSYNDLVQFASRNQGEGVLVEPRFYFDFLDFPTVATAAGQEIGNSDSDALKNGEQFPVRLTHLIFAPLPAMTNEGAMKRPSQAAIQDTFFRVERYGEFYMNERLIRGPAWQNKVVAPPTSMNNGIVTHRFAQPLVLSSRDSFKVELEQAFDFTTVNFPPYTLSTDVFSPDATTPVNITVQFTGLGFKSGRPYLYAGSARKSGAIWVIDSSQLQNTGNEPVIITEMTVMASLVGTFTPGEEQTNAPQGTNLADARLFRIAVRQNGNGTQAWWFRGPVYPTAVHRMPLCLLGTDVNNAVVHKFPGDGLTLEPGELLRVRGSSNTNTFPVAVAAAGYIMVT